MDEAAPATVDDLVNASLSQWRAHGMAAVLALRAELRRVEPQQNASEYGIVQDRLLLAERILLRSPNQRSRRRWFTGSDPVLVFGALSDAEQAMTALTSEPDLRAALPDLRSAVTAYLTDPSPAAHVLDQIIAGDAVLDRSAVREIRRTVGESRVEAMAHVKNFQNKLLILSAVLTSGLAVVMIVQALDPTRIPLATTSQGARPWDAFEVMILGAVGGAVAALIAAARQRGYRGPYALGLTQSLLKLPAGAATALVGVLLLQNGLIGVLGPQSDGKALAYAALFGYAQQMGTRLLDQAGEQVIQAARSKDDPAKKD